MFMNKLRKNQSAALRASRLRLESLEERQLLTALGLLETPCVAEAAPLVCAASDNGGDSQVIALTGVETESTTWNVTSTADSGDGSLRNAIVSAKAGDTIVFDDSLQGETIKLKSTLKIQKALTIDASDLVNMDGTPGLKIDAQQTGSVINVSGLKGDAVVLKSLEIVNGNTGYGGGLFVAKGSKVEAIDLTITGNTAVVGAGVYVLGEFLSVNTTISANQASQWGGGVHVATSGVYTSVSTKIDGNSAFTGGGVFVDVYGDAPGSFTSYSTTITDNESSVYGGGVYSRGKFTAFNTTIAGNTAGKLGGGVNIATSAHTNWFYNSIVYGNTADNARSDINLNVASDVADVRAWYTLSSYTSWRQSEKCVAFDGEDADLFAAPADGDYSLKADSVAIDAGDNLYALGDGTTWKMIEADLDGNYRMRQGKDESSQIVDLGAYEYNSGIPATIAVSNVNDVEDLADGAISLREAVKYAAEGDTIEIYSDETYVLAGKQIEVDKDVTINGVDANDEVVAINESVKENSEPVEPDEPIVEPDEPIDEPTISVCATIDGAEESRIFYVAENCSLQLNNLTLQNGKAGNEKFTENGGAIYNDGVVSLVDVDLKNNVATKNGGAVFNNTQAQLTVTNGTISGNYAVNCGGAFANYGSSEIAMQISGATISENSAKKFGGAYFGCGELNVGDDTTFSQNKVTARGSKGGAIYNDKNGELAGSVKITGKNVKFSENSAVERGGAIMSYSQLIVGGLATATFEKNTAEQYGGAIDAGKGCSAVLAGVLTFTENKATSETYGVGFGGAIFSAESLSFAGGEYTFTGNTATKSGGAIDASAGSLSFVGKFKFDSNGADKYLGGAIVSAASIVNFGEYTWSGNYAKYGNCVAVATNIEGNEKLTATDFGLKDDTGDFGAFNFTSSKSMTQLPFSTNGIDKVFTDSEDLFDEFAGLDCLI